MAMGPEEGAARRDRESVPTTRAMIDVCTIRAIYDNTTSINHQRCRHPQKDEADTLYEVQTNGATSYHRVALVS